MLGEDGVTYTKSPNFIPTTRRGPNSGDGQLTGFNFAALENEPLDGNTDADKIPVGIDCPCELVELDSWRGHDPLLSREAGTGRTGFCQILLDVPFVCSSHEREVVLEGPAPRTCDVGWRVAIRRGLSEVPQEIDFTLIA